MGKKAGLCIALFTVFMLVSCGHVQKEKFDTTQLKNGEN